MSIMAILGYCSWSVCATLSLIFITTFILWKKWIQNKLSYWKARGVQTPETVFLLGNLKPLFTGKIHFGEMVQSFYDKFKNQNLPHGGVYFLTHPVYMPVDPEIIKHIMQVDYQNFIDRGVYYNEESDPLSAHLFALEGEKWKNLRTKFTPAFTSGKLRMMFGTLENIGGELIEAMDKYADKEAVDIKDISARFNIDIIGSCAFGLETNSLKNPKCEFRIHGDKLFEDSFIDILLGLGKFLWPDLMRKLGVREVKKDFSKFFIKMMKNTVEYREQNSVHRNDFLQMMIDLKNKGEISQDTISGAAANTGKNNSQFGINFTQLVAQSYVFFLGGFETSASTMTFALYELCEREDYQEKSRAEINEALQRHHGKYSYDALNEMTFMEKIIQETLRKHPPAPFLSRRCSKNYKVPGTDLTLEEGTRVFISVMGINYDERHYPDPEVFDPERFSEENKKNRHPFTFMPFGAGPRVCIGARFSMIQVKYGLSVLLRNYRFKINNKTKLPIRIDPDNFLCTIDGGLWLDCEKIHL